ncbi:histidine kinase [Trinickia violacea]|uniref:Histidine kinase n=1 Tax=Trinickia violacea TaxID=2571746 RepID=A0A4P8IUJ7_9BURK|nr:7TM diverse intracellular signaling domain-containing protein [Trinickia violacea]QCP52948.1 histidine kinase [Trinickia violacea]
MRVEAARSTWLADAPPASGWVSVSLPDDWSTRWPEFDGVVWYRLTWQQPKPAAPVAVMLDYLNMAGAVYLNGELLTRDPQLVEPLTRTWNTPRYQSLPPSLLREGSNTLLLRVSGLAAYQPGLGWATIGDATTLQKRYDAAYRLRHDLELFGLSITATLGCFFLSLWLMRRQDATYGWFTLMSLAWGVVALNQVVSSPWPFATTDAWEQSTLIALCIYSAAFTMFIVRFCDARLPRAEFAAWLLVALSTAALLAVPHRYVPIARTVVAVTQEVGFLATCCGFLYFAWRAGRTEHRMLSLCIVTYITASIHDLLSFIGVLTDNHYYTPFTSQFLTIGMALVLGWRFVSNLRRIERFNQDLVVGIADAKAELASTLGKQHELEVANAHLNARLNLAHDLHDGLGGMLVSSITTLELAPHAMPPQRFLSILKELRDDLRIIIDTASSENVGEHSLAQQIGPLRHRLTRLLENQDIECRWQISGVENCYLRASQTLDIMRIVQEALTNVLKHSRAQHVSIAVCRDENGLRLVVEDDGIGLNAFSTGLPHGTGMRSMRNRARRLGGTFDIQRTADKTLLSVHVPHLALDRSPA